MLQVNSEHAPAYMPQPKWLTPKQASGLIGCEYTTFRQFSRYVRSKLAKPGGKRFVYRETDIRKALKIKRAAKITTRASFKVMAAVRDGKW